MILHTSRSSSYDHTRQQKKLASHILSSSSSKSESRPHTYRQTDRPSRQEAKDSQSYGKRNGWFIDKVSDCVRRKPFCNNHED